MDVLKRIEQYRNDRGWSLYKLADEAGISQSALSNMYARGTMPSMSTVFNICEAFGISPATFFAEGPADEQLSADEATLVADYRKLSKEDKELLRTLTFKLGNK